MAENLIKHVKVGRNVYSDHKELKFWVRLKCSLCLRHILHIGKAQGVHISFTSCSNFCIIQHFFRIINTFFCIIFPKNICIIFNFFPHPIRCPLKKNRFCLILKDCMLFCNREYPKIRNRCVGFLAEQMVST